MNGMPENYRPFANGSQSLDWEESNCMRCIKGCAGQDYSAINCPILDAIVLAYVGDGTVSEDIARRMGYLKDDGSTDGRYAWPCTEVEWTEEWQAEYARQQDAQESAQNVPYEIIPPLFAEDEKGIDNAL